MAITIVTSDMVSGGTGRLTNKGWEVQRKATLTGVGGVGHAQLYNAVQDYAADINGAALGAAHPTIPNIYLNEISPKSIGPAQVELLLRYGVATPGSDSGPLGELQISVSSVGTQKETSNDADGALMAVKRTTDVPTGAQQWQTGTVSVLRPLHTLTYTRREASAPDGKGASYVGKINGSTLCTGITGQSDDGGDTYVVTYTFQIDPDGWDKEIFWTDDTGKPPKNAVEGDGKATFTVYKTADFSSLSLPSLNSQ